MATLPLDMAQPDPANDDILGSVAAQIEAELEPSAEEKLALLAQSTGDISDTMDEAHLARLGQQVVTDYEQDLADREDWARVVRDAQESAAQEKEWDAKNYPWELASNIRYPMLTIAATQFNARSLPAIVKGDEAVSIKTIGRDNGRPQVGPDGQPAMQPGPDGQPQPVWQVPPGSKAARAARVSEYMNTQLFYQMDGWEADTDALLIELPIAGCAFRKVWWDSDRGEPRAAMIPALRLVVPSGAKCLKTSPRITEEVPDVYPVTLRERMRAGLYRDAPSVLPPLKAGDDDEDKPRLLLEQHRLVDLDEDGVPEPYIITVDRATAGVLRIESNFSEEGIKRSEDGRLISIEAQPHYVKYGFLPHPQGKFYDIGLGHLLRQVTAVIDTSINQLIDAGHAQIAGGGFVSSGVRLGRGSGGVVKFEPGRYKTIDGANGAALRDAFFERTFPSPSPIMQNVLELMLGAARDIASVKDVLTGEASNNGQVGTTLALIEQGLQQFTAVYKRVYRGLREEFQMLFNLDARYGGDTMAQDYQRVLDDPAADFFRDFSDQDMDIRPVSDPSTVTSMQRAARAQGLVQMAAEAPDLYDRREVQKRALEAMGFEDIDKLLVNGPTAEMQQLQQQLQAMQDQLQQAQAALQAPEQALTAAKTGKTQAEAARIAQGTQIDGAKTQAELSQVAPKNAHVQAETTRVMAQAGSLIGENGG